MVSYSLLPEALLGVSATVCSATSRSQTDVAPQSRKSDTQERARSAACVSDFPWGVGGIGRASEWSRLTQAEKVFSGCRIRLMLGAFSVQGGDKKQKRAVLLPLDGFPPLVDFLFLGAPRNRGFQGGETKAGEKHESGPPDALIFCRRRHSASGVGVSAAPLPRSRHDNGGCCG